MNSNEWEQLPKYNYADACEKVLQSLQISASACDKYYFVTRINSIAIQSDQNYLDVSFSWNCILSLEDIRCQLD